jgi:Family of unknown function (DUF6445)
MNGRWIAVRRLPLHQNRLAIGGVIGDLDNMQLPAEPAQTIKTERHTIQVWRHGTEQQPVIVIDDYLDDPDAMIELAASGPAFTQLGPYYPGIRAPFPDSQLQILLEPLASILPPVFGYGDKAGLRECSFSLVTTRPQDLMPIQRLPHFDSLEYGRIAALLFLGKSAPNGGTAFFRQCSTGFETVDAGRFAEFQAALNQDVAKHGMPGQNYIRDDSPLYETLAVHEGKHNRMLVYASANLHCGRLPNDFAFDADPRTGRLTVNAFLGPD